MSSTGQVKDDVGKVIGWLGGIVATVFAGWLVWYITLPKAHGF
jgi:hypothetical protein